jgi:hypothetical protein
MQAGLDVGPLAEEIAQLIVSHRDDQRLQWYDDGRVRVFVGKILPESSAVKQTLAGRRKRIRTAVKERLAGQGWLERGANVYER